MLRKWKKGICYIFVLTALPYLITIFINGPMRLSAPTQKQQEVAVMSEGDSKAKFLSLDEYGMGMLAREIPMSMDIEAVKAQAILVRTGIYKKMAEKTGNDQVVFSGPYFSVQEMEKEWGDHMEEYYSKLKKAWNETKERILTYGGKPAYTPFCRLTNGKTRNAAEALNTDQYPYLKSVDCSKDIEAKGAFQTKEIKGDTYEIAKTDSTGYVLQVKNGEQILDGDAFRDQFGLVSSSFTLKKGKGKTDVTTKGNGHGLGMSQNTADQMAKEGKDYKEILAYFFEGTTLQEVAEILSETE
ncbi:MAG: SpoIID/LytB domain-containing protein [Sellimonas sp.]|uniref:SpoIID/LytB domain-containing protein n=1 Tax=Sellimonas sp. TaxID=2021466 RepID=UPI0039A3B38F